jgi:hypothetical protein
MGGPAIPARDAAGRESFLRARLPHFAEELFPDDTNIEWIIHGYDHH